MPTWSAIINQLNAEWVGTMRRVSPRILMDILDLAEPQLHAYFASLDPQAPATIGVAWAGEERSLNWFDLGGSTPSDGFISSRSGRQSARPA